MRQEVAATSPLLMRFLGLRLLVPVLREVFLLKNFVRAVSMRFQKGSIRKSLTFSLWDGLFASMMQGINDNYLLAYAIALGATVPQVAFLSSLPVLLASALQIHSAKMTQVIGSRTKLINRTVFFHALSWGPVVLVPYLFPDWVSTAKISWVLLAAVAVLASCGAYAVPAWQSLMSDYIPLRSRGKYFGWRNRLQGVCMIAVSVGAGLLLNYFGKERLIGFTVIFTLAMACRFLSWACLTRMKEPYRHASHDEYFGFVKFVTQVRTSHVTRFVVFFSLMSFSVSLSSPLLSVFLLRDLSFSYASYMVVVTTAALTTFLGQGFWGKLGDRHGCIRAMKTSGWGIAVLPLFWMVSQKVPYLFFVQLMAGFVWGGFTLLANIYLMEAIPPERRIRGISYFNLVNALFIMLGAACGGVLIRYLPKAFGYSYLTLFLVSCVARAATMFFGERYVKEIRGMSLREIHGPGVR